MDEIKFIIFQRKGHEIDLSDPKIKEEFLPKNFEEISNDQNIIGMISSSEVRKRITLLRNTDEREIEKENNDIMDVQKEKQDYAISQSKEYSGIVGLVTKSTVQYIKDNKLYW